MKFNFISNFKLNRSYRNLAVFYLLAMLVFSALYVCMLPADAAGPVFVGNETELRDAITNAVEPTIIALTADISLSGTTLNISADKDITLTSLGVSKGVF
ncbi:MAG: hypothetical protein LBH74_09775 [Nitrososphaerota archaeon]|jgi:hypothetical protein|nr:hypothetical protein [Nitrososphaerota archaeon]